MFTLYIQTDDRLMNEALTENCAFNFSDDERPNVWVLSNDHIRHTSIQITSESGDCVHSDICLPSSVALLSFITPKQNQQQQIQDHKSLQLKRTKPEVKFI